MGLLLLVFLLDLKTTVDFNKLGTPSTFVVLDGQGKCREDGVGEIHLAVPLDRARRIVRELENKSQAEIESDALRAALHTARKEAAVAKAVLKQEADKVATLERERKSGGAQNAYTVWVSVLLLGVGLLVLFDR